MRIACWHEFESSRAYPREAEEVEEALASSKGVVDEILCLDHQQPLGTKRRMPITQEGLIQPACGARSRCGHLGVSGQGGKHGWDDAEVGGSRPVGARII